MKHSGSPKLRSDSSVQTPLNRLETVCRTAQGWTWHTFAGPQLDHSALFHSCKAQGGSLRMASFSKEHPREPDNSEFGTKPERLKAYFPSFTTHILPRKSADFTVSKGFEMLVRNPVVAGRRPVPSARGTPGPGSARAGPGRTWPRWAWTWVTTTC